MPRRSRGPVLPEMDGVKVGSVMQAWQGFGHGKPWRTHQVTITRETALFWFTADGDKYTKESGALRPRYLDYVTFIRPIEWELAS